MNVLCVCLSDPLGRGGFEVQLRGLVRALAGHGVRFGCLTAAPAGEAAGRRAALDAAGLFPLGVRVVPPPADAHRLATKVLFWAARSPSRVLADSPPGTRARIGAAVRDACRDMAADVVHALALRSAYYLPDDPPAGRVVWDLVDAITLRKRREVAVPGPAGAAARARRRVDLAKTARVERDILRRAGRDPVAVVSEADAAALRELCPGARVAVVPFGVGVAADPLPPPDPAAPPTLAFWGVMKEHNAHALNVLLTHVLPLVRRRHPAARVRVTGLELGPDVLARHDPAAGVEVVPAADDLPGFVAPAGVTCWPFESGAGVKSKILEAMALGRPVVTTPLGIEWMPAGLRAGVRVGATPAELAARVADLFDSPAARAEVTAANLAVIRGHYTWARKADAYLDLYRRPV